MSPREAKPSDWTHAPMPSQTESEGDTPSVSFHAVPIGYGYNLVEKTPPTEQIKRGHSQACKSKGDTPNITPCPFLIWGRPGRELSGAEILSPPIPDLAESGWKLPTLPVRIPLFFIGDGLVVS